MAVEQKWGFNSEEYSWSDIKVFFGGREITGITGVKLKESQAKTNIYAKGNLPVARGRGNVMFEGEISLLQSEMLAILASVPTIKRRSLNVVKNLTLVCTFMIEGSPLLSTHIATGVEFTEFSDGGNQGDDHMPVQLPLIVGHIKWLVPA